MRRALFLAALVLVAVLLQSTILSQVRLLGARPELLYVVTVAWAILEGPTSGAILGFAAGMTQDFFLNQPKGATAMVLTLVGYAVGAARPYFSSGSALSPAATVAAATFAGQLLYAILVLVVGELDLGPLYVLRVALLTAIYGAALTPLVLPAVRRVRDRAGGRVPGRRT